MRVGEMIELFELQSMRIVEDGEGGLLQVWSTTGDVWGCIEPVKQMGVAKQAGELSHVVTIRARDDVTINTSQRLVMNGDKTFRILSIAPTGKRGLYLKLYIGETKYLN